MYRVRIKQLINWKLSKNRKPLIVQGARQVGKTWLIKEFGNTEFRDVGLLAAKSGLNSKTIVDGNALFEEYKGALTEQFVMQQLASSEIDYIGYWTNEKNTNEVDFVIQTNGEIIPIEAKAGENLQAKSFKFFCEKYQPKTAIRTSLSDYRQESWMTNVPLYIIGNYFL